MQKTSNNVRTPEVELIDDVRYVNYIVDPPPLGSIEPIRIRRIMAVMRQAHKYYNIIKETTKLYSPEYRQMVKILHKDYYNTVFLQLSRHIMRIISQNRFLLQYKDELFSDLYCDLCINRDYYTKINGCIALYMRLKNYAKPEEHFKREKIINNILLFYVRRCLKRYAYFDQVRDSVNTNLEEADRYDMNYIANNHFKAQEIIIDRASIIDKMLALHNSLEDIRISRDAFEKILRAYLKKIISRKSSGLNINFPKFEVDYTLYKLREFIRDNHIHEDIFSSNTNRNEQPVYPSFTKILANKLGIEYEEI